MLPRVNLKLLGEPSGLSPNHPFGMISKSIILVIEKVSLSKVSRINHKRQQTINKIFLARFLKFFSLPITSQSLFSKNFFSFLLIQLFEINQNRITIPKRDRLSKWLYVKYSK